MHLVSRLLYLNVLPTWCGNAEVTARLDAFLLFVAHRRNVLPPELAASVRLAPTARPPADLTLCEQSIDLVMALCSLMAGLRDRGAEPAWGIDGPIIVVGPDNQNKKFRKLTKRLLMPNLFPDDPFSFCMERSGSSLGARPATILLSQSYTNKWRTKHSSTYISNSTCSQTTDARVQEFLYGSYSAPSSGPSGPPILLFSTFFPGRPGTADAPKSARILQELTVETAYLNHWGPSGA